MKCDVKIELLMQTIVGLDKNASIKYSYYTGMFYLNTRISAKGVHDTSNYGNINAHEYTISDCIKKAYFKMQGKILKIEENGNVRCAKFPTFVKEELTQ